MRHKFLTVRGKQAKLRAWGSMYWNYVQEAVVRLLV